MPRPKNTVRTHLQRILDMMERHKLPDRQSIAIADAVAWLTPYLDEPDPRGRRLSQLVQMYTMQRDSFDPLAGLARFMTH